MSTRELLCVLPGLTWVGCGMRPSLAVLDVTELLSKVAPDLPS